MQDKVEGRNKGEERIRKWEKIMPNGHNGIKLTSINQYLYQTLSK